MKNRLRMIALSSTLSVAAIAAPSMMAMTLGERKIRTTTTIRRVRTALYPGTVAF